MKITNQKIVEALKNDGFIRTDNFTRNCMLHMNNGTLEFLDWGQPMDCEKWLYNHFMQIIQENTFYICDEMGKKI